MSQGKGKGGGAKGKKPGATGAEEKSEDVLQAVILADSFQDRFAPFTLEKPRCLLPLANTPLIEYTLEYLAMNGVQEVFIYCGNHTDQVEAYISESPRWSLTGLSSPFSHLEFVRVNDASSPGDFLRDLDKRGLISGDFILVNGDLVANIPLDGPLTEHRRRREANRDAIMTMVLREAGAAAHPTKAKGATPLFVVEAKTGRCLYYEEINPLQPERHLLLDPAILEHGEVDLRADLIDCQIDICTPDVLALWSDSFDYESPRKNFLHGVLKDWELNGKLIYTEIVNRGYGARVSSLPLYEAVTRDVMARWSFPMVPDSNLVHGQSYTLRGSDFVYAEKGVKREADADITKAVVGMKTTVGTGSSITNSVIGRRCQIGSHVLIKDSFIWDDCTIEDGARISRSVLAESVTVGKNTTVPDGSIVSYGVQVGDGLSLPPQTILSLLTRDRVLAETDTSLLGPSGKGANYRDADDEDKDDEDEGDKHDPSSLLRTLVYSTAHLNLSASSISSFNSDLSDESADDLSSQAGANQDLPTPDSLAPRSRLSSFNSDGSGSGGTASHAFHIDAVSSLVDALRSDDTSDLDAAKLEFMGLRLANDASDAAVRRAVATALVRRAADLMLPSPPDTTGSGPASWAAPLEPSKAAERTLTAKKGTAKFVSEVGVCGEETSDQALFALALQKAVSTNRALEPAKGGTLLAALLQHLYNLDVLEEDGILAWWGDKAAAEGSERMSAVRERCQALIDWLQQEDDDSDEDETDDE